MAVNEQTYTMKVVARRTGLSPHLIRAWERRYGAVEPSRTETNRRLYGEQQVRRLRMLARLTEAGYSIGQIARLGDDELSEMVTLERSLDMSAPLPSEEPVEGSYQAALMRAEQAIQRLDSERFKAILTQSSLSMGHTHFIDGLLVPLLHRLGVLWERGDIGIGNEHMASATIRTFMGNLLDVKPVDVEAPHLLATTPSGQWHELGALLSAATAAVFGWRATYLGPNLPAPEIAAAARTYRSRVVSLSLVYPADDPTMGQQLRQLREQLPGKTHILVGGAAVDAYASQLESIGATVLPDLHAFRSQLAALQV